MADNNTFGTVDNKRTCISNQREVTHKYFLASSLTRPAVEKADLHAKRCGIRRIPFFYILEYHISVRLTRSLQKNKDRLPDASSIGEISLNMSFNPFSKNHL